MSDRDDNGQWQLLQEEMAWRKQEDFLLEQQEIEQAHNSERTQNEQI